MTETNGNPTPDRLAELERENARLRAELATTQARQEVERQVLDAHMLRGVPLTPEGVEKALTEGETLGQFLDRLGHERGQVA